jgi:hypothetical protein
VVKLDLAHAELIDPGVAGVLGELRDGVGGQLQILMKVHESTHVMLLLPGPLFMARAAAVIAFRRVARARSSSTAKVAASRADPTAIRAICQPGMPPATTMWTAGARCCGTTADPPLPPAGTSIANAGVVANATTAAASPARTQAIRRMCWMGFMTISFGSG